MNFILRFLFAGLALSPVIASTNIGSVQFSVVDAWGNSRNYKVLHFRPPWGSPDLASKFRGLLGSSIPYGTYEYELVPIGRERPFGALSGSITETFSGSIDVYRPSIHVTKVGASDFGDLATFPVDGVITPVPTGQGPVWVIVQSAYGDFHHHEASVDAQGYFQLDWIMGNNVVVVCVGSDVLLAAPLTVKWGDVVRHLTIDLKTHRIITRP